MISALFAIAIAADCKPAAADCKSDDDCANGSRCNDDGKCEAIVDGGSSETDGAAPPTGCSAPTTACTADTECCTGRCSRGRCASGTGSSSGSSSGSSGSSSGTSSGAPACQDLYQLCSGDECCAGLTCENGACR